MSKREAYVEKMAAKLKEWDAEIEKLENKAESVRLDLKTEYQKQVNDLKQKAGDARKKLDNFGSSGEEAWERLTSGLEDSWNILSDAIKGATDSLKDHPDG